MTARTFALWPRSPLAFRMKLSPVDTSFCDDDWCQESIAMTFASLFMFCKLLHLVCVCVSVLVVFCMFMFCVIVCLCLCQCVCLCKHEKNFSLPLPLPLPVAIHILVFGNKWRQCQDVNSYRQNTFMELPCQRFGPLTPPCFCHKINSCCLLVLLQKHCNSCCPVVPFRSSLRSCASTSFSACPLSSLHVHVTLLLLVLVSRLCLLLQCAWRTLSQGAAPGATSAWG